MAFNHSLRLSLEVRLLLCAVLTPTNLTILSQRCLAKPPSRSLVADLVLLRLQSYQAYQATKQKMTIVI